MNFDSDVTSVKGIGEKYGELLSKLGIFTVKDLIKYFPRTYDKYEKIILIKDFVENERNVCYGRVISNGRLLRYGGKNVLSVFVSDAGGEALELKFYNAAYLLKTLKKGSEYVFRGYVKSAGGHFVMLHPKMYAFEEYVSLEGTIGPIYSVTSGISQAKIEKSIKEVISLADNLEDYLSEEDLLNSKMNSYSKALRSIHFPKDEEDLYFSRRRLVFEEFISFYHMIKSEDAGNKRLVNTTPFIETAELLRLEQSLPFTLTNGQKNAIRDVITDMSGEYIMNRLLQGDVGSGKTMVALFALLMCAANGYQGALMAPTEILASQHFDNIKRMADTYKLPINPVLLLGKMSKKQKDEALEKISGNKVNVIIGTHALFQEKVSFDRLKLVITDEQHRFGVHQREGLRDKGINPHILVMSATPIPRTLAMIMYGNVDISVISELPKNRIPVNNCVVDFRFLKKSYDLMEKEINMGHRVYIICPMIDESETDNFNLKNVNDFSFEVKEYFGDRVVVGTLHGKLKSEEKERLMREFKNGNIDILVSTTVIEVGVDVPEATVMLIVNAERFGLSQLHQLRGRVGRSNLQSYCILMSDSKNEASLERLKILNKTNDGFEIAREDMKMRGPGELNGVRQSGELSFSLADITNDQDIFMLACELYDKVRKKVPEFNSSFIDFRTI